MLLLMQNMQIESLYFCLIWDNFISWKKFFLKSALIISFQDSIKQTKRSYGFLVRISC